MNPGIIRAMFSCGMVFFLVAPVVQAQAIHYHCDTSGNLFMRDIRPVIKRVQNSKPDIMFHLYEGPSSPTPGYSFLYWQKKGVVGNKLFAQSAPGSEFSEQGFEIDNSFLKFINVDSVRSIFQKIAAYDAPAGYRVPQDHLLYLEIFSNGQEESYRMCESQLALYRNTDEIYYFRRLLAFLRGRASG